MEMGGLFLMAIAGGVAVGSVPINGQEPDYNTQVMPFNSIAIVYGNIASPADVSICMSVSSAVVFVV